MYIYSCAFVPPLPPPRAQLRGPWSMGVLFGGDLGDGPGLHMEGSSRKFFGLITYLNSSRQSSSIYLGMFYC